MPKVNEAGIALIRSFEGFRSYPYRDAASVWTIGYGHTEGVHAFSTPITESQADELLQADAARAASWIERFVHVPLNENQFSALASLVYNAGTAPLEGRLGELLNAGDDVGAAREFGAWTHAGGAVSPGLARRRAAEAALFLTPEDAHAPALP